MEPNGFLWFKGNQSGLKTEKKIILALFSDALSPNRKLGINLNVVLKPNYFGSDRVLDLN